jgi:4-hydroxy-tetrahydrodipicolinate reductase
MTLPIAIAGAAGRMGRALIRAAMQAGDFTITGGSERPDAPELGADLGALAGLEPIGAAAENDVRAAAASARVWIDFTAPAATLAALDALSGTSVKAAIIGTTGFTPPQENQLSAAAQKLALVRSGNFSLGVNLLAALAEQGAKRLGSGWDVEIHEAHHRHKRDAPSGTALMLGEAIAAGRNTTLDAVRLPPRDGDVGPRPPGGIGFAITRAGGIIGEHEASFSSEREVLRLSHQALDRAVFADGALAAARWAADKPPGLYSMRDVLGF